ncbi:MAG TPA: sigma-54 dependent transcriptional regulator [Terriglobales bacterium]|nr:sigma-54 dependent transcriptional regulator [Terriglobales bacterium]
MNRVLVVDDDAGMRAALETRFLRRGWSVDTASGASGALDKFRRGLHPLIVTDIRMPGEDGLFVMRSARQLAPHTAVILLTAYASIPGAVAAMKDGACDYLVKPVSFEQLEQSAERILAQARSQQAASEDLVGHAPAWLRALARAGQAAASNADVLIEAESGTGKELVARLIHRLSPRRDRPFVAVNCAAFPEALLESELFGHARGAFTGASHAKPGKFELANGGTLLLDEIGEMPLVLQPKLLRALQEREFDRLGDTSPVRVDLRVIATTNCALGRMVREGRFRADLYYRLNVIPLSLPPLRERAGDVRELAEYFVRLYSAAGQCLHLSPEVLEKLEAHSWPGNVRELANCMRRAVALSGSSEIGVSACEGSEFSAPPSVMAAEVSCLRPGVSLGDMERKLVEMTLAATGGNRSRAAELLGVSLRTVRNKVRSYGLPTWSSYVQHD